MGKLIDKPIKSQTVYREPFDKLRMHREGAKDAKEEKNLMILAFFVSHSTSPLRQAQDTASTGSGYTQGKLCGE
jgi:hypothetical protein